MNKVCDNIYSVGAIDSDVRIFHGYEAPIGTTYNAYLVVDEKITLIDFVKNKFSKDLLDNIKEVIGEREVDYIIANHAEPDHSGALPEVLSAYPNAKIYGTANCQKELAIYYPQSRWEGVTVKNGDSLCTGQYNFQFIPMPMVHWPDSMATYLTEEKILFSNDALGQHIGTGVTYDTELSTEDLLDRMADYYANIVLPFGLQVEKLLGALGGLDIQTACPSHGVILRESLPKVLEKYVQWSKNTVQEDKVVVVYDTMWGTTHKMALRLEQEYSQKGMQVELICLSEKHYSHAMARLIEAKYIFVGSPTLNNQMMPTVSAFLTYMKGLKPKNRIGMAFGSYGWSGESIKHVDEILASCGFEMLEPQKVMWNV